MQLTTTRLQSQIQFIVEIDKLKHVLRQTLLMDKSRRENDAEHSWHLAMMAIVLAEYADPQVNLLRVLKMVLIHDLVEIDAGDTFCYDALPSAHARVTALQDQAEREEKAADRLFGMLPENLGVELRSLWEEFEAKKTLDAQFAAALEREARCKQRLQPLLHNYYTEGGTWRKAGVTVEKVRKRMAPVAISSPLLGEFVENLIQDAVRQGFILKVE